MGDISTTPNLAQRGFYGPIEFPGFNLIFNPDTNFFGTNIHWYGIIIAVGLILAIAVCLRIGKKHDVSEDTIFDMVIFGAPSAVICARIYYVIFKWDSYKNRFSDVFKIWEGGIAIYGAVIGAVAAVLIYCKIKKINPLKCMDVGCIGLAIGQAVGRWGNFVNREAFGAPASSLVPWRMKLYTDATLTTWAEVHPTFLYESLWNIGVTIILIRLIGRKKFDGQVFWTYLLSYGAGRLWIEGMRLDSLYLGPVRISQIVAFVTVVLAIIMLTISLKRMKNQQHINEN